MRTLTRVIGLSAAAALLLSACASGADETTDPATGSTDTGAEVQFEAKDPLKIGYSVYDLQNPYWQSYTAGVKAGSDVVPHRPPGEQGRILEDEDARGIRPLDRNAAGGDAPLAWRLQAGQ